MAQLSILSRVVTDRVVHTLERSFCGFPLSSYVSTINPQLVLTKFLTVATVAQHCTIKLSTDMGPPQAGHFVPKASSLIIFSFLTGAFPGCYAR